MDRLRWLWSYYASRLPGAKARWSSFVDLTVKDWAHRSLKIRIRNNGFDYDVVEEIFAQNVYRIELPNVKRIMDLGGNIGMASLYFSRLFPDAKFCIVEPSPYNLSVLEHNLKSNGVDVEIIRGAAGGEDGKTTFLVSGDPRQDSCANTGFKISDQNESFDVDVYCVPTLMKRLGWDEFDLLKIDIEGSEVAVLGGRPEWLKKVRAIIGEGHVGVNYTIEACRKDLEPMGFEVKLLDQREGAMVFYAYRPS